MRTALLTIGLHLLVSQTLAADPWLKISGEEGPGKGKKVVLVSGDEEYRSEETLPQLAKILAKHHGFDCQVLFAIDKNDGTINPNQTDNIPGLEALRDADLMIIFTRFRSLPDDQMKELIEYTESGRPIIGLRTATHAFNLPNESKFRQYTWNNGEEGWEGGFGRKVLGETWVNHHGDHGSQSTRGILNKKRGDHPILKGIKDGDIWGPTDVYGVHLPLPEGCDPLVYGQVLVGMKPEDEALEGAKNDPMMPVVWTNTYKGKAGKEARVLTTTMGASQDFSSEGLRRLLVNATYWAVELEEKIPEKSNVELVGKFEPSKFAFGGFKKGIKPSDHAE